MTHTILVHVFFFPPPCLIRLTYRVVSVQLAEPIRGPLPFQSNGQSNQRGLMGVEGIHQSRHKEREPLIRHTQFKGPILPQIPFTSVFYR